MSTKKPAFRSASEFVRAADTTPPPAALQLPEAPAPEPAPAVRLVSDKKPARSAAARPPAPAPAPEPMPWASANERVIKHFGLRMPETLHAKLTWVQEQTPNATMHSLALDAVAAEVERRIAQLAPGGTPAQGRKRPTT